MEQFFNPGPPEAPEIQLCIFPHLREFLVFDARAGQPHVRAISADEVFGDEFFAAVEAEFSHALRHTGEYPFFHLMNLTMHFEEVIREVAMTFILARIGVRMGGDFGPDFPGTEAMAEFPGLEPPPPELPSVVVYVVTGGVLTAHSEAVLNALRDLLADNDRRESLPEWEEKVAGMVAQEQEIMRRINRQELIDAVRGDAPDYFTMWDNLN